MCRGPRAAHSPHIRHTQKISYASCAAALGQPTHRTSGTPKKFHVPHVPGPSGSPPTATSPRRSTHITAHNPGFSQHVTDFPTKESWFFHFISAEFQTIIASQNHMEFHENFLGFPQYSRVSCVFPCISLTLSKQIHRNSKISRNFPGISTIRPLRGLAV